MALYAVIKGDVVDGIAVRDDSPCSKHNWIPVDGLDPQPGPGWTYKDGVFSPPVFIPISELPPEKTEEEKIADATAAAIAKLIADGVLKQV